MIISLAVKAACQFIVIPVTLTGEPIRYTQTVAIALQHPRRHDPTYFPSLGAGGNDRRSAQRGNIRSA
jgi:hypothetical protein